MQNVLSVITTTAKLGGIHADANFIVFFSVETSDEVYRILFKSNDIWKYSFRFYQQWNTPVFTFVRGYSAYSAI